MRKAKILGLDCETAPNKVFVWSLWKPIIPANQIISTSRVMCWSAKWLGEKGGIMADAEWLSSQRKMLRGIWKLLNEADIVVHFNGKSFDVPKLNKDFLMHDFSPPSPFRQVDLIETAKRKFAFVSNSLKHIAQELELREQKRENEGFKLWVKCMAEPGFTLKEIRKARIDMVQYNKGDTKTLDELYWKFLPWIDRHPNVTQYMDKPEACPKCGGKKFKKDGTAYTQVYRYQRYRCESMGKSHWFSGERLVDLPKVVFKGIH